MLRWNEEKTQDGGEIPPCRVGMETRRGGNFPPRRIFDSVNSVD